MPTVVDALIVTLGLNAGAFVQGAASVGAHLNKIRGGAAQTGKDLEEFGKRGAMFFSNIKTEALGLIGVLTGATGLGLVLSKTADSLASLNSAAINIGRIDVSGLDAINKAFNRNGTSANAASDALQQYANTVERARLGGDQSIRGLLAPIGGTIEDSPLTFLQKAQAYVQAHLNDPNGGALIQQTLGRIGLSREMIDAMIKIGTVANLNREVARSIDEIGVATKEQVEAANKLQHAFRDANQAMDVFANRLMATFAWLAPIIEWMANRGNPNDWRPNPMDDPNYHGEPGGLWDRLKQWWNGGSAGGQPGIANTGLLPHQQAFLQALSKPESGGDYAAANVGGQRVADLTDLSAFPTGPGHFGRYQFDAATWQEQAAKLGLHDFSPGSQDRAAWELAFDTYYKAAGRSLEVDLRTGGHDQDIAKALRGRWPSVPGGAQSSTPLSGAHYGALTPGPAARAAPPAAGPAAGGAGGAAGIGALTPGPAARAAPPSSLWAPPGTSFEPGVTPEQAAPFRNRTVPNLTVGSLNIYGVQDPHTMGQKASQALASAWTAQFNRGLV